MTRNSIKQQPETPVLRKGTKRPLPDIPTFWYDYDNGRIIFPDHRDFHKHTEKQVERNMPLDSLFSGIQRRTNYDDPTVKRIRLFIRAGTHVENQPVRDYFRRVKEWKLIPGSFKPDAIHATYSHNGFKVYLYSTGKYFDDEKNLRAIHDAYYTLQSQLDDKFQYPNYTLAATPSGTGRKLLEVSLPDPKGVPVDYARLPDDILRIVYKNCCYQNRIEHFPPKQTVLEDGPSIIDGAWEYAGCLFNLPTGKPEHDFKDEIETYFSERYGRIAPKYPGFYRVTFTVPDRWSFIGLLKAPPCRRDDHSYYPNKPGETFMNWTTADELVLAFAYGWKIVIHERIYFPHLQTDPFYNWLRAFIDLRKKASLGKSTHDPLIDKLLKAAYRNIVLHTIGSLKQSYTTVDHFDLTEEQYHNLLGYIVKDYPPDTPDRFSCKEEVVLPRDRQIFVHPEWTAAVWGKARAWLAECALKLQLEGIDILSLRTDAIWCTGAPDWIPEKEAWNNPGDFVRKDHIPGRWTCPRTSGEWRRCVIGYNLHHGNPSENIPFDDDYDSDESEEE